MVRTIRLTTNAQDSRSNPVGIAVKSSRNSHAKRLWVAYVPLVAAMTRWRVEGREHLETALREDGSAVVCFWQRRLMLFPVDWPWPSRTHVLISAHRDSMKYGN